MRATPASRVVAVKIGGSEESRKAALAHTGALAGSLECFDAVAETSGVVRVDTLDEIVETVEYFCHAAPPKGPRLGAMTFSGGIKGLMLEAAERNGLSFPALLPETNAKVSEVLGVGTSLGNPLDAGFAALSSAEAYFRCIEVLLAGPQHRRAASCKRNCRRRRGSTTRSRTCARSTRWWRTARPSRWPWSR